MTVMPEPVRQVNEQLASLALRFAEGELDRVSFRQQRRQMICDAIGVAVPDVPAAHDQLHLPDEDDTQPGAVAADTAGNSPSREAPAASEAQQPADPLADNASPDAGQATGDTGASAGMSRDATLKITLLLLMLAFVGLGGLLWFVLR